MGKFSVLGMFDKLDDIIYKPIEALTEWVKEPLRQRDHKRQIERDKAEVENEIARQTEIKRISAEIEEWRNDKSLERMEKVAEATIKYQKELTRINTDAIAVIGHMQLDLRNKALEMILDKTARYEELQNKAMEIAFNDAKRVEEQFGNNEAAQSIFLKHIDSRMANIINSASDFIQEINNDLNTLNKDISRLTDFGQQSIEKLMDKFRQIGGPSVLPNVIEQHYDIESDKKNYTDKK